MKISGIDFPRPLLTALRNGKLVVFAGAGVSMGEPANLPSFMELVEAIAQGSGETLKERESEDRFLGRLQYKGVEVHELAVRELSRRDSKPTPLHQDLLRIYSAPQAIRVVTTNFDPLFEQAADGVFESQPEVFQAPALPLGTDFNGIVHVHGSLEHPGGIVLTDADFGRAYLTEGWARRFLVDLFRSFTVLFVGYRHNDTVMNYLARALPTSEKDRFALTDEASDGRWHLLGVEPIVYTKPSENDHSVLYDGIGGLARYLKRGILDWQREVKEIAKNPPSLNEEEMDLIEDAISDPKRTHLFTDVASNPEWIVWLERRNRLDSLFDSTDLRNLGEQDSQLAQWLAQQFARDHADELFLLIGRKGMRVHPAFWNSLGLTIGLEKDQPPDADILARWVSLLIETAPSTPYSHVLFWLGERCADAELAESLLAVFDLMAASRLNLKPGFAGLGESSITGEVVQNCDHYEMNQLWEKGLKPRLDQVAERLLAGIVQRFIEQHRTLRTWQSEGETWDPISLHRSAIEPHQQDEHPDTINVLINAARDCLEYLACSQPEAAGNWCDRLIREGAPLLRRLAAHALPLRKDLAADEKSDWLLRNMGLHDLAARHETFQAMRTIYPKIGQEHRDAVIEAILAYVWASEEVEQRERFTARHHFEWLHWLHESDPTCELVGQSLKELRERHSDFQPSEHPDFLIYTTPFEWVEPRSPLTAEELVQRPARKCLPDLLHFHEEDPLGPSRDGLLHAVEEAATQRFEWGLDLASALADSSHWETDLWLWVIRAWSQELNEEKHRRVLRQLSSPQIYSKQARPVADLLYSLVKNGGVPYAASLLLEANELASALWSQLDQSEPPLEREDWLFQAINHSAGVLTQFWLGSFSLWQKQQDPRPNSFGDVYSSVFSQIVREETFLGRLGKAVLSRALGFLLTADEEWTTKNLIPLFESTNDDDCRAVWDGFLNGNLLNPQVGSVLENAFVTTGPRMRSLFPNREETRNRFVEFYALMAKYCVEEPLQSWIPKFFEYADTKHRRQFARTIQSQLHDMDDASQRDWWNRWLMRYWESRLRGIPVPLTDEEVGAMLDWLPQLKSVFPEAVGYAIQMPLAPLERTIIIHGIRESTLWSKYPDATATLLGYLAKCESQPWVWYGGEELIRKLVRVNMANDLEIQVREIAVRFGWGLENP